MLALLGVGDELRHSLYRSAMRALILLLAVAVFAGCQKKPVTTTAGSGGAVGVSQEKPLIRVLRFVGGEDDYGIEVNGNEGFLRQDDGAKRPGISFERAAGLLEEFYAIPGIEGYRGKKSDNRQSAIHHLIFVYDEVPSRYEEETVDYVIPKAEVREGSPTAVWLEKMRRLREEVQAPVKADGDAGAGAKVADRSRELAKRLVGTWVSDPASEEAGRSTSEATYREDGTGEDVIRVGDGADAKVVKLTTRWKVEGGKLCLEAVTSSDAEVIPVGLMLKDVVISISDERLVLESYEGYGERKGVRSVRVRR